jgi:asparagine synthetase B (glutamine-hydrolysing)
MLDSILNVQSFCWAGEMAHPAPDIATPASRSPQELRGQFAFAAEGRDGTVTLVRDGLGLNKLFFAVHESGTVHAANYLIDLVRREVPFEAIQAVPAGHFVEIDPHRKTLSSIRHFDFEHDRPRDTVPSNAARMIRQGLDRWFSRLSRRFTNRRICVALSGDVDSGTIAAIATQYFPHITAYTCGFVGADAANSEDVSSAERLARHLGIGFRFVAASATDVMQAVDNALCYGQDWRSGNVQRAIVNDIIARAIRSDAPTEANPPLVLTGDLANEFLADCETLPDNGESDRPAAPASGELRHSLIRSLDVGDREIGIFNHHGVHVIQPYGLLLDEYLRLPISFLSEDGCRPTLAREIAGDVLPDFLLDRAKMRSARRNSTRRSGVVPVLAEHGCDAGWLRQAFCRLLRIKDQGVLRRLVRAGRYRFMSAFPGESGRVNGYLVA